MGGVKLGWKQRAALKAIAAERPCHSLSSAELGPLWDRLARLGLLEMGPTGWALTALGSAEVAP